MVYDGVEKETTIPGEYKLSATLTVPLGANEPLPAVVIVPGTGSADRDGNFKNNEWLKREVVEIADKRRIHR